MTERQTLRSQRWFSERYPRYGRLNTTLGADGYLTGLSVG